MKCEHLFERVQCKGYMKPIKDGSHIEVRNADGSEHNGPLKGTETIIGIELVDGIVEETDLSSCEGGGIIKTYYQRKEKTFSGIVVGAKRLYHKALLYSDVFDGFGGTEYFIGKEVKSVGVYIVYFGNNKKRYVLPEDIENY